MPAVPVSGLPQTGQNWFARRFDFVLSRHATEQYFWTGFAVTKVFPHTGQVFSCSFRRCAARYFSRAAFLTASCLQASEQYFRLPFAGNCFPQTSQVLRAGVVCFAFDLILHSAEQYICPVLHVVKVFPHTGQVFVFSAGLRLCSLQRYEQYFCVAVWGMNGFPQCAQYLSCNAGRSVSCCFR